MQAILRCSMSRATAAAARLTRGCEAPRQREEEQLHAGAASDSHQQFSITRAHMVPHLSDHALDRCKQWPQVIKSVSVYIELLRTKLTV